MVYPFHLIIHANMVHHPSLWLYNWNESEWDIKENIHQLEGYLENMNYDNLYLSIYVGPSPIFWKSL